MSEQILSNRIKFLIEIKDPSSHAPLNKVVKPLPSRKWEELFEMIDDLLKVRGELCTSSN